MTTERTLRRKLIKEFHIMGIYHSQLRLCKERGYVPPAYTAQELQAWCLAQTKYHDLHAQWVASGFKRLFSPSIDRLDDYKSYSLDNIQLMTSGDNLKKSFNDTFNGVLNKRSKAVIQKTLSGDFVAEFPSCNIAGRSLGKINGSSIVAVCQGKRTKAHGYLWEYKA